MSQISYRPQNDRLNLSFGKDMNVMIVKWPFGPVANLMHHPLCYLMPFNLTKWFRSTQVPPTQGLLRIRRPRLTLMEKIVFWFLGKCISSLFNCYWFLFFQIVTSSYTDFQDYTYYFVPAPWLSVKLLRLLQNYPPPGKILIRNYKQQKSHVTKFTKFNSKIQMFPDDPGVRGRLNECLETILNKAQEPPKSKKVQHSNAKNSVLFEAISLIIHNDR